MCRKGKPVIPYSREEKHWIDFFAVVADRVIKYLRPKTALDIGCAKGFLVESLRDRGVEAFGVDLSEYAIGEVRADIKPYCSVKSILQIAERDRYDLVVCIEVLEHLTEEDGIKALQKITRLSDRILFSASSDDFDEPTHINVRPVSYWMDRFAEFGFVPVKSFRAKFISNDAVLFRKRRTVSGVIKRALKRLRGRFRLFVPIG